MASLTTLSCLDSVKRNNTTTRPDAVRPPAVILFEYIGDRSGSTSNIAAAQMTGLQKCIDDRREDAINTGATCFVSITTFDDEATTFTTEWGGDEYANIKDIPKVLDVQTMLEPRGCTRLVDTAYERAIAFENKLSEIHESLKGKDNDKVVAVFTLSTDGMDNASDKYKIQDLNAVIRRLRKGGAEMMFLAANQDAIATGTNFGFAATHAMTFGATPSTAKAAFNGMSQVTRDSSEGMRSPGFSQAMRQSSAPSHNSSRTNQPMMPSSLRMTTCVPQDSGAPSPTNLTSGWFSGRSTAPTLTRSPVVHFSE